VSGTFVVIVAGRPGPVAPRGGLLSSAILYLAIVVIWAGVLIPRWLRRDTSVAPDASEQEPAAGEPAQESGREEDTAEAEAGERGGSSSRGRRRRPVEAGRGGAGRVEGSRVEDGRGGADPVEGGRVEGGRVERRPGDAPARDRNRDRARMLSARRRLLGLLVLLAIASGVLAERRLAAWWVVLPPIVMLVGYLGLLREASKADAERLAAERSRTARGPAAAPASAAPDSDSGVVEAPEVPERRAEIIEISATWEQVEEEELYDQYADAKRRAVGD
jgi:hypothetical protein